MKRLIPILSLVFFAALLAGCVSKADYQALEDRLTDAHISLDQKKSDHADCQDALLKEKTAHQQCLAQVSDWKSKYEKQAVDLRRVRQEKTDAENANINLSLSMDEIKTELEHTQSVVEAQKEVINRIQATKNQIEASLKKEIEDKEILIQEIKGRLTVTFVDKILFNSGSDKVKPRGKELLAKIADSIKKNPGQDILVEGHTDNLGISGELKKRFPSNWELSTARATAVVRYLAEKCGVPPERLVASGYSYYHPVASNDTAEGRSQNRRIEIVLLPPK